MEPPQGPGFGQKMVPGGEDIPKRVDAAKGLVVEP
jgi:hypothetical protein